MRIHWVSGQARVWLHDPGRGRIAIGLREWRLLSVCDGTRDLAGIVLAAGAKGTRTTPAYVEAFLSQLAEVGLLAEGPPAPPVDGDAALRAGRPLRHLSGYALACDGRGSCCRFFGSTTFSPREELRARALGPEVLDGLVAPERLFAPSRGSAKVPWEGRAVAMVDGRCAFLEGDDGCGIHRRGGAAAKPAGCRAFPAELVGTADEVFVTPRPECACVMRSARQGGGEPLLAARHTDELPAAIAIRELGEVALAPAGGDYRAWHRALDLTAVDDAPGWLDAQAEALGYGEADADALWRGAAERVRDEEAWRAPTDLVRRVPAMILEAGDEAIPDPIGEGFYLRAVAHGHLWAFDGVTVAASLRLRAAGLRLARRCRPPADDPAFEEPIALVEAFGRRAGLLAAAPG